MPRKKYRLRKEEGNFIDFKNEIIKIDIPVTEKKMEYTGERYKVSSQNINAILVRIKGSPNKTPDDPVKDYIEVEFTFEELDIKEDLEQDPYLLVIIFNNTRELLPEDVSCFREEIKKSSHYVDAIHRFRYIKPCQKIGLAPLEPREQDGDVIGGQ